MKFLQNLLRKPTPITPLPSVSLPYVAHPDTPLVQLNRFGDCLRVRDFYEHIVVLGGTGSGKSSGSGRTIRRAMLQAGWGGLVLCAKPGEAADWIADLTACGRGADLIHMQPGSPWSFNFIDYEVHRPDGLGTETFNLVALLEIIIDASAQALSQGGRSEDASFWIAARRELLANAIEPLVAATGRFRLDDLMRFVTSAPASRDDVDSDSWMERSFCYQVLRASFEAPHGAPLPPNAVRAAADYWFSTYASLDPKTRSNIIATLTSAISPFLRGVLHDTFCTETRVIPELSHEGAVIVVDFPIKTLGTAGVVAAQIMKYQWQKATERRVVSAHTRPAFLHADECQYFLSKYDAEFQSTARSARAATIFLTQNLPTFFMQLPGRDPRATAESLLGNFQTKIFHANTDVATNQYASELIGKTLQRRASQNWSVNDGQQFGESTGSNWSDQHGESSGRNWGGNSSFSASSGTHGQSSSTGGSGRSWGKQTGTSRSWSSGGSASSSVTTSQGASEGGGWSEQMDFTVPSVAFASMLRKGGAADGLLVDAVVVQGGRRFAATGSHWLHCTFHQ